MCRTFGQSCALAGRCRGGREEEAQREFDEAIAAYQEVLELEPNNPSVHYFLALALGKAGRKEEAQRAFAEAQRLDPNLKPPE
ncbi:MAG: tetratricopeptide repeat protein [Terriglobia bacterium]